MTGVAQSMLTDLLESVGPITLTSPDGFINDATRPVNTFSDLAFGFDEVKKPMLQNGDEIQAFGHYTGGGSYQHTITGSDMTYNHPQRMKRLRAYWRESWVNSLVYDQELDRNEALTSAIASGDAARTAEIFFRIMGVRMSLAQTDFWEGADDDIFAVPDYNEMELQDGTKQYSLFSFINEFPSGLFGSGGSYGVTAWTQILGQNPASADFAGRLQCQTFTYSSAAAGNSANVIQALSKAFKKLRRKKPAKFADHLMSVDNRTQFILTSDVGGAHFEFLLREGQDFFVAGPQDPDYDNPQFKGVEVRTTDRLDSAAVYVNPTTNGLANESAANLTGARYYIIDGRFLYPCFHVGNVLRAYPKMKDPKVPTANYFNWRTDWNLFCLSFKQQALVSPSTDLYTSQ